MILKVNKVTSFIFFLFFFCFFFSCFFFFFFLCLFFFFFFLTMKEKSGTAGPKQLKAMGPASLSRKKFMALTGCCLIRDQ